VHGAVRLCVRIEEDSGYPVRLVVLDPITAYVGSKDGHNTSDVRGLLAPLISLADRRRMTVWALSHLNKSTGMDAMSRVTGSGAYVAASRLALIFGDHPELDGAYCMAVAKTNLGKEKTGIGYRVVEVDTGDGSGMRAPRVEWIPGVLDVDADSLLAPKPKATDTDEDSAKGDAVRHLMDVLKSGPVRSPVVYDGAKAAGISKRTLERARGALDVRSVMVEGSPGWHWRLPLTKAEQDAIADQDDATQGDTDTSADEDRQPPGHLAGGEVGEVGDVESEDRQDRQGRHPPEGPKGGDVDGDADELVL